MTVDPITEEIREIRRRLAAQCGNDLARIFADLRQREATDGRKYVTLPPRRIQPRQEDTPKLVPPSEVAPHGRGRLH